MSTAAVRTEATRRQAERQRLAALNKQKAKTPVDEATHFVGNEQLPSDNESGRQADDIAAVERDSEIGDWQRISDLEAPPARPGYVQRWIRTRLGAGEDPKNVSRRFREGWRPRKASSVPDGHSLPTIQFGQFGEVIGVEEMMLCEMPDKNARQRKEFYRGKLQKQTKAIEANLLRINDPRMPISQRRKSTVSFRPEGVAEVADD